MIIKKKESHEREIDLTGPNGNAYFLLGTANIYSKQLGLNSEDILKEMKSGDYENLITIFDNYFGDFITLLR